MYQITPIMLILSMLLIVAIGAWVQLDDWLEDRKAKKASHE